MNRRDFFKMAGIGLAGLMFPNFTVERQTKMFGDILYKLATRTPLTATEMNTLKTTGNLMESFVNSIQNGQGNINAKTITAANLIASPPVGVYLRLLSYDVKSIVNNVESTVQFQTEYTDTLSMWNDSAPTAINIQRSGLYQIFCTANWEAAAAVSGQRRIAIVDANTTYAYSSPTDDFSDTVLIEEKYIPSGTTLYVKLYQNSGSDINAYDVRFSIRLVGDV